MKSLIWIIAIFVLQAVIAAIAKRAQETAKIAKAAAENVRGMPFPPPAQPRAPRAPNVKRGAATRPSAPPTRAPQPPAVKSANTRFAAVGPRSKARLGLKPTPPATGNRAGDSASALLSRQHVADSVAKVRAAEVKAATGLASVEIARTEASADPRPAVTAADVRAVLKDRARIRQAFVLGELLGPPRCQRPI